MQLYASIFFVGFLMVSTLAQSQAPGPKGTTILNQNSLLGAYKDKQWFINNIPFLEVPDANVQEIYYYRWYTYWTNLRYTNPEVGYLVTEFSKDVGWQMQYGGIVCAAGHQLYEGRWLKDQRYMNDEADFWGKGLGLSNSRNYSFWKADSYFARYMVNGDAAWIKGWYTALVDNYNAWNRNYNPDMGLYWREGVWDGMELSATSLQSQHNEGVGYRPTINTYQIADALAISKIAAMQGNTAASNDFKTRAQNLKDNMHAKLWDNSANFFKHRFRDEVKGDKPYPENKYYAKEAFVDAREQHAYTPWYLNAAEDDPKYIAAWNFLFDATNGFYSNYGPTTLEKSHRLYRYQDSWCCHWNGMSWPFSTAQTLKGISNVLHFYKNKGILNKDRYFDILKKYTLTHYKDGKPYIAEAHDPETAVWTYDLDRSKHYNHSSYNDLIITGLLGFIPRADNALELNPQIPDSWNYFLLENVPYHGHLITILYDKTGTRYQKGAGLKVYQDGLEIQSQAGMGRMLIPIATPDLSHNYSLPKKENYATNCNKEGFPIPSASYSSRYDNVWEAVDGRIRFDVEPRSRWTNWTSKNPTDWFAVDYGTKRTINRIDLMFYDDNGDTRTPVSYVLQYWNGSTWLDIPQQSRIPSVPVNDRNTVTFPDITASQVRVVMTPKPGFALGLTEFETWKQIGNDLMGDGNGLTARYFEGMNFEKPKVSRIDETVDFNWGNGSPDPSLSIDKYSARWVGQIQPHFSEEYTFHINSDNGRRLWIDNKLVIDKWINDYNIDYAGNIKLEGGKKYDIKLEYFEDFGGANILFQWESPSQFLEIVPKSQLYSLDTIPGRVEAERFSNAEGIQKEITADDNGVKNIGYIENGDWSEYKVYVNKSGKYTFNFRVASATEGGNISVKSGATILATISVTGTKGWQNWTTVSKELILSEGLQTLRLEYSGGTGSLFNLNWFEGKPYKDCNGTDYGLAIKDACGQCVGGITGKTTLDTDKDGIGDCVDPDDDNDGVDDTSDCDPLNAAVKGASTWYADTDGDGVGDPNDKKVACTQPAFYVLVSNDLCPSDKNKQAPGNCGCNKTEESCLDCFGTPNGMAAVDVCGVCSGGLSGIKIETDPDKCTVTTIDTKNASVNIYPNPFKSAITIENSEGAWLKVTTLTGVEIYQEETLNFSSTINLPQGVYILNIIKDGKSYTRLITGY